MWPEASQAAARSKMRFAAMAYHAPPLAAGKPSRLSVSATARQGMPSLLSATRRATAACWAGTATNTRRP